MSTQPITADVVPPKPVERPTLYVDVYPLGFRDEWGAVVVKKSETLEANEVRFSLPGTAELRERDVFLAKAIEVCRRVVSQNTAVIAGPDTYGKAKAFLAYMDSKSSRDAATEGK